MLDETIKRLEAKTAMNLSCLDCFNFDQSEKDVINYEGQKVRIMRGCKTHHYRDCHKGGYKSLWAAR